MTVQFKNIPFSIICPPEGYHVRMWGRADYPEASQYGPRTLKDFEFIWILEGGASWEVDGQEVALEPGSMVLGMPGWTDTLKWNRDHRSSHGFIHFTLEKPQRIERSLPPKVWHRDSHPLLWATLESLLLHLDMHGDLKPEAVIRLELACQLAQKEEESPLEWKKEYLNPPLVKALSFLKREWTYRHEENKYENIPVADLAKAAKVSTPQLTRYFRKRFDFSPAKAVLWVRMHLSHVLLRRGAMSVAEVGRRSGFENPFHFSRAFKSIHGYSPSKVSKEGLMPKLNPSEHLLWWAYHQVSIDE